MKTAKRSSALIELIIVIAFLSIALTIIVQMFANVYQQNRTAIERNNALVEMQDQVELFKADPTMRFESAYYYDNDFLHTAPAETATRCIEVNVVMGEEYASGTMYTIITAAYRINPDGEREQLALIETGSYLPKAVSLVPPLNEVPEGGEDNE